MKQHAEYTMVNTWWPCNDTCNNTCNKVIHILPWCCFCIKKLETGTHFVNFHRIYFFVEMSECHGTCQDTMVHSIIPWCNFLWIVLRSPSLLDTPLDFYTKWLQATLNTSFFNRYVLYCRSICLVFRKHEEFGYKLVLNEEATVVRIKGQRSQLAKEVESKAIYKTQSQNLLSKTVGYFILISTMRFRYETSINISILPIRKSTMVHCRCTMVHWQCTMVHRQCTMLHFLMGITAMLMLRIEKAVFLLSF